MTKLERLVRNDKVLSEIKKIQKDSDENVTFNISIDCLDDVNEKYIDVLAYILVNDEKTKTITVAQVEDFSEKLLDKARKMKQNLISYLESKLEEEIVEEEIVEESLEDVYENLPVEEKIVEEADEEKIVEEKKSRYEYDELAVETVENSVSKSDAIRKLYDLGYDVKTINYILNNELESSTRYQMVYQVVERYELKIELQKMSEEK